MSRMHVNEGSLFGRAQTGRKSRYRAKKTRERVASVTAMPDRATLVHRKCFTCEAMIECDQKPVTLPDGFQFVIPQFTAPLICRECRKDKKKFYIARKAMHEMFEWKDTHVGHGWEG